MRTQATLDHLVDTLIASAGDWSYTAKATGTSLAFIRQWRADDPETDKILKEAERDATQGLVGEAIRRAVRGVEEDVYYKGDVVGSRTVYSDSLLTTLLKARVAEFRDTSSTPQVTVNVANLMPRASSYDEWLAMKESTLTPEPAIEAPFKALDAPAPSTSPSELEAVYAVMAPSPHPPPEGRSVQPSAFKGIDL